MDKTTDRIKADAIYATDFISNDEGHSRVYLKGYKEGYIAGATAENNRFQPVIDALAQFIARHDGGLLPDRLTYEKGVKALEEWKGTGKEAEKCQCVQSNWNAFTGKCLTCGKS